MHLQLIKTHTGEAALVVHGHLILDGDAEDDSWKLVEQTAERLAEAMGLPLELCHLEPKDADWEWEQLLRSLPSFPDANSSCDDPESCHKCGSLLLGGMCKDETCPYSDWPQHVDLADIEALGADAIVEKYALIRAEAHSDDRVFESAFFANDWFLGATADAIKALSAEEWSHCEEADDIARSAERVPAVDRMFSYLAARCNGNGETVGFECSVNVADALDWLRRYRYGLWCQLLCEHFEIRIVEAEEAEIAGRYDWLDSHGNASEMSMESADEAAMDAVRCLSLDTAAPITPLYSAFWASSAFYTTSGKDARHTVGIGMFCEAQGYEVGDIEMIKRLSVGQTWSSVEFGGLHTITRVA